MIVRCDSCYKRYQIDDEVIGSKGQNVRCTLCGNIWFQEPATVSSAIIAVHNLPAVVNNSKSETHGVRDSFWKHALICVSVLFIGIGFVYMERGRIIRMAPSIRDFYELMDMRSSESQDESIRIKSVTVHRNGNDVVLRGEIHNSSQKVMQIPPLIVSFVGKNGANDVIKQVRNIVNRIEIMPEENLRFEIIITSPPKNFAFVKVSI